MRLLTTLHRWTGGIVGLFLAVLGLTGAALVWEEAWIGLPGADDPWRSTTADLAHALTVATADGRELGRMTFAGDGFGLHQAVYADGGGAYLDQSGRVVASWASMWERPELWLFDIHHHLLMGHTGETISGVLGLLLLAFAVTGCILWWRTRKTFAFRLWPKRMSRSAIVRQHRDIGVVASPMLLVTALTGSLMIFQPMSDALLAPWAGEGGKREQPDHAVGTDTTPDFTRLMASGQAAFPSAMPRRFQMPKEPGQPAVLRLRQNGEWTPNGRSHAFLDPATGVLAGIEDPMGGTVQQSVEEKYYPIHAGKVGGIVWQLLLTFGGLVLALLGTLATWSFWFRKPQRPAVVGVGRSRAVVPTPAE